MTHTTWYFEFDLITPDGITLAECISFRCELSGVFCRAEPDVGIGAMFESVDCNSIEVEGWTRVFNPDAGGWQFPKQWVPLPDDLKPCFNRWLESDIGRELAQEALFEAHQSDADDAAEWRAEMRKENIA